MRVVAQHISPELTLVEKVLIFSTCFLSVLVEINL